MGQLWIGSGLPASFPGKPPQKLEFIISFFVFFFLIPARENSEIIEGSEDSGENLKVKSSIPDHSSP